MNDSVYIWRLQQSSERGFWICLAVSACIHGLLFYLGPEVRRERALFQVAVNEFKEPTPVEQKPAQPKELKVYLTREEPEPIAFAAPRLLRPAAVKLESPRIKRERKRISNAPEAREAAVELKTPERPPEARETLLDTPQAPKRELPKIAAEGPLETPPPEPVRAGAELARHTISSAPTARSATVAPGTPERAVKANQLLLKTPDAPDRKLPEVVGITRLRTFRDKLKLQVYLKRARAAKPVRIEKSAPVVKIAPAHGSPSKKSFLADLLPPEKKPTLSLLSKAIKTVPGEAPKPFGQSLVRSTAAPNSLKLKADKKKATLVHAPSRSAAKPKLLALPQPSMPRVALNGKGKALEGIGSFKGLPRYKLLLLKKIKAAAYYPPEARRRGEIGTVTVRFSINRAGKLRGAYVHASSKFPALDAAALDMVRKSVPNTPFPADVTVPSILFEIDIIFKLGG